MAERKFDPRFDPAFQRGYEPPVQAPVTSSASLPSDPIGAPPAGPKSQPLEGARTEVEADSVAVLGWRRVNPYVVILWVVGVIFVVGGAALLFFTYIQLFSGGSQGSPPDAVAQTFYVFGSVFTVPLITVGLGTIVGLVFLSAVRSWRRRDRATS